MPHRPSLVAPLTEKGKLGQVLGPGMRHMNSYALVALVVAHPAVQMCAAALGVPFVDVASTAAHHDNTADRNTAAASTAANTAISNTGAIATAATTSPESNIEACASWCSR